MRRGWLDRAVGVIVGLITGGAAVVIWFAVSRDAEPVGRPSSTGPLFGAWHLFYNTQVPHPRVLAAGVAFAIMSAGLVTLLERRAVRTSRRSMNAYAVPLSPRIIMAETRGQFHGEVTVTVLIPARNEQAKLPATLTSLYSQSRRPERVIVVADNCSDATARVALEHGAEVFEPVDNAEKKAGALNQALRHLLPGQGLNDTVMIMDADTTLDDGFLQTAVGALTRDRALMAVGAVFYGEPGSGLLGQLQRNEFTRYARELRRRRGRVYVLTGTASIFRPQGLRTVADRRGVTIPGVRGDVYDTAALTEDNELTLALKSLGAIMVSPADCTVVTEVMPSVRTLWVQRLRWERGALDNVGAHGLRPQTVRYWAQQLSLGYSVIAYVSFLLLMAIMALALDEVIWFPFWLGVGAIFYVERLVTVWKGGWSGRIVALTYLPELAFDLFLSFIYVKGVIDITFGRKAKWGTVRPPPPRAVTGRSAAVAGVLLGSTAGALLPGSTLRSQPFAVLAAFVAVNTVVYVILSIAKLFPKVYIADWYRGPDRRSETRSIYPDAAV